jgi:hypothetical protein
MAAHRIGLGRSAGLLPSPSLSHLLTIAPAGLEGAGGWYEAFS